jgi:hypothetical protein
VNIFSTHKPSERIPVKILVFAASFVASFLKAKRVIKGSVLTIDNLVLVIAGGEFAAVTVVHDVVEGAGILDAKFAGHAGRLESPAQTGNSKHADLRDLPLRADASK